MMKHSSLHVNVIVHRCCHFY